MSKKQTKEIKWPSSVYFTIDQLIQNNPEMITKSKLDITLRKKLEECIRSKKVMEIGNLTGGKGRPKKVFAILPVTSIVKQKALSEKINLVDDFDVKCGLASHTPKPVYPSY